MRMMPLLIIFSAPAIFSLIYEVLKAILSMLLSEIVVIGIFVYLKE